MGVGKLNARLPYMECIVIQLFDYNTAGPFVILQTVFVCEIHHQESPITLLPCALVGRFPRLSGSRVVLLSFDIDSCGAWVFKKGDWRAASPRNSNALGDIFFSASRGRSRQSC
jgi:hypothetical protein